MSRKYLEVLGEAATAAVNSTPGAMPVAMVLNNERPTSYVALPGVALAIGGALAWDKHRWLGLTAGHALGSNAYDLAKGSKSEKISAACRVAIAGAAVGGSLHMKKRPVVGYFAGLAAGALLSAVVPGSDMNKLYKSMMKAA